MKACNWGRSRIDIGPLHLFEFKPTSELHLLSLKNQFENIKSSDKSYFHENINECKLKNIKNPALMPRHHQILYETQP